MIVGTGVDLCDVVRVRPAMERHGQRFKDRRPWAPDGVEGLGWRDVEVTNLASGRPTLVSLPSLMPLSKRWRW